MSHPSGMLMHKNERRSAVVRLKHPDDPPGNSLMNKTHQHTVSQGPGVLLGNMAGYKDEINFIEELTKSRSSASNLFNETVPYNQTST